MRRGSAAWRWRPTWLRMSRQPANRRIRPAPGGGGPPQPRRGCSWRVRRWRRCERFVAGRAGLPLPLSPWWAIDFSAALSCCRLVPAGAIGLVDRPPPTPQARGSPRPSSASPRTKPSADKGGGWAVLRSWIFSVVARHTRMMPESAWTDAGFCVAAAYKSAEVDTCARLATATRWHTMLSARCDDRGRCPWRGGVGGSSMR